MIHKILWALLLLTTSCTLLTACSQELVFKGMVAGVAATANGYFSRPDVNLKEKNYAAADYLIQQMRENVDKNAIIVAQPLEEADHAGISSPLGSSIPQGVGLRLSELGYNVYLNEVAPYGNAGLYPPPPVSQSPNYVLKGTYLRKSENVDVSLRLINLKTGRIAASFDYALLLSKEVKESVKTQTRIFRVPD